MTLQRMSSCTRGRPTARARAVAMCAGLLLALVGCASSGAPAPAGPGAARAPTGMVRAQAGDTVYFIEHYVRPERRQQFEEFVDGVLFPAFQRTAATTPARARILRQTRLLKPVAANEDGTWTYTFVLDPVVPGESYSVLDVLRAAYSEDEAKQHYGRFTETWARDFVARRFVQSREHSTP